MAKAANILHLAYSDASGVPSRWAAAHARAGHMTRVVFEVAHPYAYVNSGTVYRWTPSTVDAAERAVRVRRYLDWADAVMAYDHPFYLDTAIESGKPVLFRALGTSSREHASALRKLLRSKSVVRATTGLADLAKLLKVDQVGAPYPLLERATGEDASVVHAPSDREGKQTPRVIEACRATGWSLVLLEGTANRKVVAAKQNAQVVVDSGPGGVPDGYGVNSVEAMAMGLPAVAGCSRKMLEPVLANGAPVQLVSDQRGFERTLRALRDEGLRAELGATGRDFVASYHDPAARAREDRDVLEKAA